MAWLLQTTDMMALNIFAIQLVKLVSFQIVVGLLSTQDMIDDVATDAFPFECAKEPLHDGIVVAVARLTHADLDAPGGKAAADSLRCYTENHGPSDASDRSAVCG